MLRRLNCVIPREVAESMRRILIDRRMDSATTLRSAQNDNLFRTAVREGGNPNSVDFKVALMDSRLRGNDEVYIRIVINNLFFGKVPG